MSRSMPITGSAEFDAANTSQSLDHSSTNTQVVGVDEADIVKTDGKYIYYIAKNKVVIVDAQAPDNLKTVSELKYDMSKDKYFTPIELYIADNRLVLIARTSTYAPYYSGMHTVAICYDTTDKADIHHMREIEIEGSYVSSRMIGNNVYMISNKFVYSNGESGGIDIRPLYKDTSITYDYAPVSYDRMYYFPGIETTNFLTVASFNVEKNDEADIQTYLSSGSNIYSSTENMYVVSTKFVYREKFEESNKFIDRIAPIESVTTEIFKFSLQDGATKFIGNGSVPGNILNQFSMDENNNHFRIATTDRDYGLANSSGNNLYVLDENLKPVGALEGLAKGEQIYSVRFMGDRAYVVTFKQVDPLFVIDVSNPSNPSVLGELKIPGFSEYLHPYSENLLIGIGQDAETFNNHYGETTLTVGMKMALFDVTDANNPKELFSTKIGSRGTYSEVLNNHKAFLFSKEKDILSFPITVNELKGNTSASSYGELTFQGAIIYGIDLEKGFVEKGRISHVDIVSTGKKYFSYDYDLAISRIIYIGDTLFTLSDGLIKSVDMNSMEELDNLKI
jgi:uncharacterized secreted protein with C-terminal beta-propeller domain